MPANAGGNAVDGMGVSQLTPVGSIGAHKLSSDFIIKNGASTAQATAAVSLSNQKQSFMLSQPVQSGLTTGKAKFK